MARRIHISGASGSGVTTLGVALADRLGFVHLDTDDFYWLPTESPFTDKRPVEDRLAMLGERIAAAPDGWVLSGSATPWGDSLIPHFDLVLFLRVPAEVRMARIVARERARYGAAIEPGGARHAESKVFLDWAAGYDAGDRPGRSGRGQHHIRYRRRKRENTTTTAVRACRAACSLFETNTTLRTSCQPQGTSHHYW